MTECNGNQWLQSFPTSKKCNLQRLLDKTKDAYNNNAHMGGEQMGGNEKMENYEKETIENLYKIRRQFLEKGNYFMVKKLGNLINEKARNDTNSVLRMSSIDYGKLSFNLHLFTIGGALEFVEEIVTTLIRDNHRLLMENEEITLITGRGNRRRSGFQSIKSALLSRFDGIIREHAWNQGRLVLCLKKKITLWSFVAMCLERNEDEKENNYPPKL